MAAFLAHAVIVTIRLDHEHGRWVRVMAAFFARAVLVTTRATFRIWTTLTHVDGRVARNLEKALAFSRTAHCKACS